MISPDGQRLYVATRISSSVNAYDIGSDGSLTSIPGSPFATEHSWTVDVPGPPVAPGFALHANRPNPFSRMTRITFELPREARVRLEVLDLGGRRVRTLIDGRLLPAGPQEVEWDGRGPRGERAHDGVYFCVMEADGFRSMRRMVLAR